MGVADATPGIVLLVVAAVGGWYEIRAYGMAVVGAALSQRRVAGRGLHRRLDREHDRDAHLLDVEAPLTPVHRADVAALERMGRSKERRHTMNRSRLTAALSLAIAILASAGVAEAQGCAERATRLKTEIDALPSSSSSRTGLSESLGIAMGSDTVRCDEILAQVEKDLAAASEATAAAEKALPNHPTSPAGPSTAPDIGAAVPGKSTGKGNGAANEPIPGQSSSGKSPPVTAANGSESTSDAMVEQGQTPQTSDDDPIPAQAADADNGEATSAN